MKLLLSIPKSLIRYAIIVILIMVLPRVSFAQLPYPQWVNDMGGNGDSKPTGMVVDKQNNIYVSGYFNGTVDFDPSAGVKNLTSNGNYDIYVAKYTQSGTLIWAESMGGSGLDQVNYMCTDAAGNITITGQTQSTFDADPGSGVTTLTNQGGDDIFMIHLDTNGGFLWAKQTGSPGTDRGEEVNADSQGNVIQTAIFQSTISVGANTYTAGGGYNGLIAKYSQTGSAIWSVALGKNNNTEVYGNAVDSNNDIIVSGVFSGTVDFNPLGTVKTLTAASGATPFIAKYSAAGQLLWVSQIAGSFTNNGSFINVDSKNNILLSGSFPGSLTFNGNTNITGGGSSSIFLAKFLPDGTFQWAKAMQGNNYAFAYQMQTDQDSNVYLTGYFSGTVDFNPDPVAAANITDHGQRDFFLAKYDNDGNYKWAFSGGSANCNVTLGIELAINANRDLFLAGSFCSTVDFDPSSCNILNKTAQNFISDSFIVNYSQYNPASVLSKISSFSIPQQTKPAEIDDAHAAIKITVPFGTDVTHLVPTITIDNAGTLAPATGVAQNFTNPVNYIVATSCSALTYTVTVITEDVNVIPVTITICPQYIAVLPGTSLANPPISYLWQINQNNSWAAASGTNNTNDYHTQANEFQNTSGAPVVYRYRRQVITSNGTVNNDSFYNVTVNPTTGNNTITSDFGQICAGQVQAINFTGNQPDGYNAGVTYAWQSSTDNATWVNINGAGQQNYPSTAPLTQVTYFRRVSTLGNCSNYSNVLKIDYLPPVSTANAGTDQSLCQQNQATLNANAASAGEVGTWTVVSPANYNPFTDANRNDQQATIANLPLDVNIILKWTIEKAACGQTSESTVTVINNSLPAIDAGTDAGVNVGESVILHGMVNATGYTLKWEPAETLSDPLSLNPVATPAVTTWYKLNVTTAQGCIVTDSVKIRVNNVIVLPNTFTPNGDGVNDTWNIKHLSDYEHAEISIFTRWGKQIYYSKGYSKPWDGTYQGKKLPASVYYYLIVINDINTKQTGWVTIIN